MIRPTSESRFSTEEIDPSSPLRGTRQTDTGFRTDRGGFDFRHVWHSILERIWIITLCVLAGVFLALGYLARSPKLYQGHVVLEVDVAESSVINSDVNDQSSRARSAFLASLEAMRTIQQNLSNRTLLVRVIHSEDLAKDNGLALTGETAKAEQKIAKETESASQPSVSISTERELTFSPMEEKLAGYLSKSVDPVIRRGTRLIDLNVTNRNPQLAQRLAEAIGQGYIRQSIERRASFTQESLRYLLLEEARLKANLQKSEAAVSEYKAKTPDALQLGGGAAATGGENSKNSGSRGGLVEDKLQELSSKLTAAKTERLRLEGELAQVDAAGEDVEALLAVSSIGTAPPVNDRRKDLAQAESNLSVLAQRYKEKHPKMMAASAALKESQMALRRAVLAQPAVLRNTLAQAKTAEKSLEAATHDQETAALALNKAAIGYQELARQADTDQALYGSVLRQIKETDLTKGTKMNAVSIVERSPVPEKPFSPRPVLALALGLLGGLAAGVAFVFVSNALDLSIKTVDQAESSFNLPVLAAIPDVKSPHGGKKDRQQPEESLTYRLVVEAPEGPAAEAFRNLRASLSLLGPEAQRKTFLFTSAIPSEGKSFTSANYALALAQQGQNVLLIDGDLRRPSLQKIFLPPGAAGTSKNERELPGIVDYLVGAARLADVVRPASAARLDLLQQISPNGATAGRAGKLSLLVGGRRAPNPAELLGASSFSQLITEAAALFDRVVIDSAPVLAVSDTLLMIPHVQSVCLVVRAAHTARKAVHRSLVLLEKSGVQSSGIILNRLPRDRGTGYYYYYASHGYGVEEGSYSGHYESEGKGRK